MRDPRFDILFEEVPIGPVKAKNRFYQVPHCSGMGWQRPQALAAMRGVKAQGGWGVVCTEYCSVHPSSDDLAYPFAALWNEQDEEVHRLMVDAVHAHDALAGVELWLGGNYIANLSTRIPPLGLRSRPPTSERSLHPVQSRKLDRSDIHDIRHWHTTAARRAAEVGFDIVYIYATHGYLLSEFLNPNTNKRTDEYGGSMENRIRLVRELIEDAREAVGHRCAVAVRFSLSLEDSETYDAFAELAELPDLWDLTVDDFGIEMGTSRFVQQGAMEPAIAQARKLTTKPVVAVGRFTSPDMMAQMVRRGVQDFIGAARPSIADPFLPRKIEEGRIDDIRECIGCNVCYAYNSLGVPIRCTQNPTMGEEWRLGWHPERLPPAPKMETALVVGAGPAGLEAARVLGTRGFKVILAEATRELGGRINREAALPGLSEWARVRDWRLTQLDKCTNVEIYRDSRLNAQEVLEVGADHVFVATGSTWTIDGVGRHRDVALECSPAAVIVSADVVLDGAHPQGRVLIYDDDHYYLGPALALHLRKLGCDVVIVTPEGRIGQWGNYTDEQHATVAALITGGVEVHTNRILRKVDGTQAHLACVFGGEEVKIAADTVLPLTRRKPNDALYQDLISLSSNQAGALNIRRIGDCEAPGLIAAAVYSGYRAAVWLGADEGQDIEYRARREIPGLETAYDQPDLAVG